MGRFFFWLAMWCKPPATILYKSYNTINLKVFTEKYISETEDEWCHSTHIPAAQHWFGHIMVHLSMTYIPLALQWALIFNSDYVESVITITHPHRSIFDWAHICTIEFCDIFSKWKWFKQRKDILSIGQLKSICVVSTLHSPSSKGISYWTWFFFTALKVT